MEDSEEGLVSGSDGEGEEPDIPVLSRKEQKK